jgi:hypothetical protein
MIEITLSTFAWLGVFIFQALVQLHFTLRRKREGAEEEAPPILEASPLVLECNCSEEINLGEDNDEEAERADDIDRRTTVCRHSPSSNHQLHVDRHSDDSPLHAEIYLGRSSFDGDEPAVFFELLSQTGSEMIRVSGTWNT